MTEHTPETAKSHRPSERLPAVWPWLLIPLVALALFFALRSVRADAAATTAAAPSSLLR